MDAPASIVEKLDKTISEGPNKALLIQRALMYSVNDTTELSLLTPNDFQGMVSYNKIIRIDTQDHGKREQKFLPLANLLVATPHLVSDGVISLTFTIQVNHFALQVGEAISEAALSTAASSGLTTTRYLRDGKTLLILAPAPVSVNDHLYFLTATVLPPVTPDSSKPSVSLLPSPGVVVSK